MLWGRYWRCAAGGERRVPLALARHRGRASWFPFLKNQHFREMPSMRSKRWQREKARGKGKHSIWDLGFGGIERVRVDRFCLALAPSTPTVPSIRWELKRKASLPGVKGVSPPLRMPGVRPSVACVQGVWFGTLGVASLWGSFLAAPAPPHSLPVSLQRQPLSW